MIIITLVVTSVLGGGMGAVLSFGTLLRNKSEGMLNIELGISRYKFFIELMMIRYLFSQFRSISAS